MSSPMEPTGKQDKILRVKEERIVDTAIHNEEDSTDEKSIVLEAVLHRKTNTSDSTPTETASCNTLHGMIVYDTIPKSTSKKGIKNACTDTIDEGKDLLIAQLQTQVSKQKECMAHYESIIQLMNYRIVKLKKILKSHGLSPSEID